MTASVREIFRYPVKSLGGESLTQVQLTPGGLPGDRAWAVRDEVNGGIRGAKKLPRLMELQSRYEKAPTDTGSSPARIRLTDGTELETGQSDVNDRLSAAIDHQVSLWPLLPADALDHYRRGAPSHTDMEQELRAMFGRTPDEPLPDLSVFPPELLEFESPPGTYFDAYPILVVTDSSLDEIQRRVPDSVFDVRRFRPNFVVTGTEGSTPFIERQWEGRRLRLGGATLKLTIECPRCVMTTHGFEDLPKDPGIMRALVKETGGNLGIYAEVETPGPVKLGDEAELLP